MLRRLSMLCLTVPLAIAAACGSSDSDAAAINEPTVAVDVEPPAAAEPASTPEPVESVEPVESTSDIVYGDQFPEVLAVTTTILDGENWRFAVTLSSTYDTPQRYADAWRVLDADGNELGIRVLGHDHANEQPFTRNHTIAVPATVTTVFVEGRDQANGWSGQRFEVDVASS